jgi:putative acetyltransferase
MSHRLRRLEARDHDAVAEIYRQAVVDSTAERYSLQQQWAWAEQSQSLHPLLTRGRGWVMCNERDQPEAFCVRDPADRISLLYCHPQRQRMGLGRSVLAAATQEAAAEGHATLRTEASLISRRLFERMGWRVSWQEHLRIGGVLFRRYRMQIELESH